MRARFAPPRPHTAGIVAALITTLGVVLEALRDSGELQHLPHWLSIGVIVVGGVIQSLTKGVHQGDSVLVGRLEAAAVGFAKPKEPK